jgi:hypothetical protein
LVEVFVARGRDVEEAPFEVCGGWA